MKTKALLRAPTRAQDEANLDDLVASLFVLITQYSLNHCDRLISPIVERLNLVCYHPEIEHYPNQRMVFMKMRQLWSTKLFKQQVVNKLH